MFGFLKDKLKGALQKFSKSAEETAKEVDVEQDKEEITPSPQIEPTPEKREEKKSFFAKLKETFTGKKEEQKREEEARPKIVEQKNESAKEEKLQLKKQHEKTEKPEAKKKEKKPATEKEEQEAKPVKKIVHPAEKIKEQKSPRTESKEPEYKPKEQGSQRKEMIFEEAPLTFNPASGGFEPDIEKIKEKEIFVPDEKKEHRHAEIQKPEHQAVPKPHEDKEDIVFTQPSPAPPSESEKKGFFAKLKETITKKIISEEQFDELFWELEVALLESNVAVEVIEKIKADLKQDVVGKPLSRGKIEEIIQQALTHSIDGLFSFSTFEIADRIRQQKEKPTVIVFMGVNGTGKTTTIAKVAKRLQDEKLTCVIAAADTFRAAALEQLQTHADNLHIKLIKHQYGSDPAAVAFDAIAHARARGVDAVLIDTAGRLHSNENLMEELKKVVRVAKPDLILFVGESITGNDCVEQVKIFGSYVNIDGVILSKADLDEKGGAAVSLSYVSGKPILYLGTGQNYDDLEPFDKAKMMERLGMV